MSDKTVSILGTDRIVKIIDSKCLHTAMEAVITAAGFLQLEAIHGIRYTKVVSDGDGSVLHTIHTILYQTFKHNLISGSLCEMLSVMLGTIA